MRDALVRMVDFSNFVVNLICVVTIYTLSKSTVHPRLYMLASVFSNKNNSVQISEFLCPLIREV